MVDLEQPAGRPDRDIPLAADHIDKLASRSRFGLLGRSRPVAFPRESRHDPLQIVVLVLDLLQPLHLVGSKPSNFFFQLK